MKTFFYKAQKEFTSILLIHPQTFQFATTRCFHTRAALKPPQNQVSSSPASETLRGELTIRGEAEMESAAGGP